jgi:BASS family bile acid:Na+ symporter
VNAALEPVIAIASFLVSTAVGTGVTTGDLGRVASRPRAVILATAAQWLLLPLIALSIVAAGRLPEPVATALLLAAACPGGALSNAYVFLAGADTALSVVLTAISTTAAAVTLPVVLMAGMALARLPRPAVADPWEAVLAALLFAVLLPVLVGLGLRHRWPGAVARCQRTLRGAAAIGVLAAIALIFADQWSPLGRYAGIAVLVAIAYGILGGASGYAAGAAAGLPPAGRFTVGVELMCRNMAIFSLVAVTMLGRPELLAIGAVFFLVQATIGLLGGAAWRCAGRRVQGVRSDAPRAR